MSVVIRINGTDITNDVIIADAEFTALVNGQAGQAHLRVRDDHQTYNFTTGKELTLDIDSVRVWGGFVTAARKVFALPVVDTTNPTAVKRIWSITGADYNVLFDKRFLFKASDPAGKVFFSYATSTYDDTIINDIFDNYLDLSGDGLTRTGVQRIAQAILDVPGNTPTGAPASAGDSWNTLMRNVARATGGVYYISPDKDLFYVDVETTDSNYTLTDTPTGAFDLGYQNFELLENGSDLINDMFVWGAGTGTPNYVFSRTTDATSVSTHGRWQSALVTGGLFRQTSADTVSHSYVYGTPQSHRGGKDNAVRVTCRVFKPYFKAGQKVQVNIGIFGYSDVLPIRSMAIKFVNRTQAYFDLLLSHVIDLPVLIYETRFFFPDNVNFTYPKFVIPPPPPAAPAPECVCGITDTFGRTTSPGDWGTSDSGDIYFIHSILGANQTAYCDGSAGVLQLLVPNGSTNGKIFAEFNNGVGLVARDLEVRYDVTLAGTPATGSIQLRCNLGGQSATGVSQSLSFTLFPPTALNPTGVLEIEGGVGGSGSQLIGPSLSWTQTMHCHAVKAYDAINNRMTLSVNVWNGATEPAGWMVTDHTSSGRHDAVSFLSWFLSQGGGTGGGFNHMTASLDNLDVFRDGIEVNRCTAIQFDNFTRVVTGGWGNATPSGYAWVKTAGTGTLRVAETGSTSTSAAAGWASVNDSFVTVRADTPSMPGGFIQTGRWAFSTLPTTNKRIFVAVDSSPGWTIKVGTGNPLTSDSGFVGIAGGGTSPQIVFPPNSFWVAGAWYLWEWTLTPGVLNQLSVWREDAPGTVYTVHQATPVATVPANLAQFDLEADRYATDIYIDYIDFNYAGKPCYACSPVYVFWDALSSHPAAGTWNPMVPFGGAPVYTWNETGVHSTNGSTRGFIGPADSASVPQEGREFILVAGPWDNEFEFNGAFEFPVGVSSNPADARAIFSLSVGGPYSASIGIGPITTGGLMVLSSGSGPAVIGTNAVQQARNWLNATLYSIKWHHARGTTGTDYVKVWVATDPEPSAWDLTLGTGGTPGFVGSSGSDSLFQIDVITKFAHVTDQWGWQGMYMTAPCGQPTPVSAVTGWVTETFVATAGQLLILLAHAFQVYTAQVFINGVRESPASYIESPNAGTVLLDTALTAGDDVVVRYYATGAIEI